MLRRTTLAACTLALMAALPAVRAEESDIASLTLGEVLLGPPVTPADLVGNVVMVEFWGTH